MLSKEALRRRTEEAARRIEQDRLLEEERRRREAEERRLEKERLRLLEARRQQCRREARRRTTLLFHEAVRAANLGARSTRMEVTLDVSEFLEQELTAESFSFLKSRTSDEKMDIELRLERFLAKLDDVPRARLYRERLKNALDTSKAPEHSQEPTEAVLGVLAEFEAEDENVLNESARDYLVVSLMPFLKDPRQVEMLDRFRLSWAPAELTEFVLSDRGHVPSWLVSTSGQGLMQRVSECAAIEADKGLREALFEMVTLPPNELRWGKNTMTKLVHRGQPIGVTPFPREVMLALFKALGVETECLDEGGAPQLRVSW